MLGLISGNDFQKLVRASTGRKVEADKRISYYYDQQSDELFRIIARSWARPQDFRLFQVNIVSKIIKRLAAVYQTNPVRTFDGADQAKMDALYAAMGVNVRLKQSARMVKLLKTCALQVAWNGARPALHLVTPNVLDVVAPDPENPERIIVEHRADDLKDVTYSDWTATSYTRRDYRGQPIRVEGNPGNVNPYGVLPFVPLFDRAPDDAFFLPGGEDLIEAQEAVNVALVNLWRSIELQSHGQPVVKGVEDDAPLSVGPSSTIYLPEGGDFFFAKADAPIEQVLRAIEFLVKQVCVTNDLSADVFSLDSKAESGAAKLAENRDLIEARKDDVELWRVYEARLFETIRAVWNIHRPDDPISEAATVAVDFPEPTPAMSEAERLDTYQRRLDLGLWSPVDVALADNPDLGTREDAIAALQQRQEEAAMLAPSFGPSFTKESLNA